MGLVKNDYGPIESMLKVAVAKSRIENVVIRSEDHCALCKLLHACSVWAAVHALALANEIFEIDGSNRGTVGLRVRALIPCTQGLAHCC